MIRSQYVQDIMDRLTKRQEGPRRGLCCSVRATELAKAACDALDSENLSDRQRGRLREYVNLQRCWVISEARTVEGLITAAGYKPWKWKIFAKDDEQKVADYARRWAARTELSASQGDTQ